MEKKFRKIAATLLCLCLLAGCGGEAAPTTEVQTQPQTEAVETEAVQTTAASGLDLADTVWELEDVAYLFYADGTMEAKMDGEKQVGSYEWGGESGSAALWDLQVGLFFLGDSLYMEGEDGNAYRLHYLCTLAEYTEIVVNPAPSADDPLDCEIAIPGISPAVYIPYPSTLKVLNEYEQNVEFDSVNQETEPANCIHFNLVYIGSDFDHYFSSGSDYAQQGLAYMCELWTSASHQEHILQELGTEFVDGSSYYSYRYHVWYDSGVFVDGPATPIRGVIELRYYGPTNYILISSTLAEESGFDTYSDLARNMLDAVEYGGGWSTTPVYTDDGRGDYFGDDYSEDGRGDSFG